MRIAADPDDFDVYKKIIKELLFNGANRSLQTDDGLTPRDLLDDIEDSLDEPDYQQLRSILTYSRPCLCFMRRRPIQKMTRSPWTLIFGILFNLYLNFYSTEFRFAISIFGILFCKIKPRKE